MRRIALTIQYLGAHYSGWQLQPNKVTVQGEVETALARILQSDVRLHCAGRTDGGVNATGMVAHFDTVKDINLSKLCMGADLYLPSDISVVGAVEVPINFDARFSAISKTYVYRMYVSSYREPLLDINHLQIYKQPDIVKMQIVADKLIGERDFSAFSSTGSNIKGTVRKLSS
ncbi:MAG: tRNA pseudouridine synthase A, partial [Clostridia bacterium]